MNGVIRLAAASLAVGLLASGCAGTRARRVPDVTGERLDVAEELLDGAGVRYEAVGGGVFGVIVRSRWIVCRQLPRAGATASSVRLVVARSCEPDWEEEDEE